MPAASLWSVHVSLAAPEQTHRFLSNTQAQAGMQHGMCLIHTIHTVGSYDTLFAEKSRTKSQAR